jgi:hypothetical protein
MNMVWHEDPSLQVALNAIELTQLLFHQPGYMWLSQPALPCAPIQPRHQEPRKFSEATSESAPRQVLDCASPPALFRYEQKSKRAPAFQPAPARAQVIKAQTFYGITVMYQSTACNSEKG